MNGGVETALVIGATSDSRRTASSFSSRRAFPHVHRPSELPNYPPARALDKARRLSNRHHPCSNSVIRYCFSCGVQTWGTGGQSAFYTMNIGVSWRWSETAVPSVVLDGGLPVRMRTGRPCFQEGRPLWPGRAGGTCAGRFRSVTISWREIASRRRSPACWNGPGSRRYHYRPPIDARRAPPHAPGTT